jgi:hypothetical protein
VWTVALSPLAGPARAMNLLSAVSTSLAGAITAWVVARETRHLRDAPWGAVAGATCAGLMATAWSNATETEVYAVALLHVAVLLACATRAGNATGRRGARWSACTAYLLALAPALHLSALVAAPAVIALAGRDGTGRWHWPRVIAITGVAVMAAAVGRVSPVIALVGGALLGISVWRARDGAATPRAARMSVAFAALVAVAASALLIMLVRARLDPPLDQGNPTSLRALADVVARRQYDVAAPWPRQAPLWLQLANVAQYADWQAALGWGHGIFTTPARVAATILFVLLGAVGVRALRRDAPRLGDALLVLLVCGTLGVATYLNLKAGSSLGWGVLPDGTPHEARERDYFFVLGFWAWGCFVGAGALDVVRARRWPAPVTLLLLALPLLGNWSSSDRSREPRASAARQVAEAFLASAPERAVLFTAGDNDSYPLWYLQQVEGRRLDVTLVTISLLPAGWYQAEIARRTGLRIHNEAPISAHWQHEQVASQVARAARRAGRPVAASPALTAAERALLGGDWRLHGVIYRSAGAETGAVDSAVVELSRVAGRAWDFPTTDLRLPPLVDDIAASMLGYLACPGIPGVRGPRRDSLEVKCNLR